ncbi:Transmembrane domain-containing protein [Brazilian cedratvirus IHUMI]|uniref:Transmembrane domain-containing protein n=1 Tax=Brazilian cedratvirus IHUMI TaxID=2126980 RepID=A0A2R8FDR4_9VIRU|nr:Transmembrane domain-containing protein [Brazilian cedratvirus IHUMI]
MCEGTFYVRWKMVWTFFSIAFATYFLSWLFLFLIYKLVLDVHGVGNQMLYSFISAFPLSSGIIIILIIFYNTYRVCKPQPVYTSEEDALLTEMLA